MGKLNNCHNMYTNNMVQKFYAKHTGAKPNFKEKPLSSYNKVQQSTPSFAHVNASAPRTQGTGEDWLTGSFSRTTIEDWSTTISSISIQTFMQATFGMYVGKKKKNKSSNLVNSWNHNFVKKFLFCWFQTGKIKSSSANKLFLSEITIVNDF